MTRNGRITAAIALALASMASPAAEPDCSEPPAADKMARYVRIHDVTIRGLVRGPDAIELELHKDVPARDELDLWPADQGAMCVVALVYDRNGGACQPNGAAEKNDAGEFVLRQGGCTVIFAVRPEDVDMRVSGEGCAKAFCSTGGELGDATFTPR